MAVGSVPNTDDLGLDDAGVRISASGYVEVDRVSRTSAPGIYAAGDCTGVLMLASVAAMQGRIAMWHALGEAVRPLRLSMVAANVFTDPEIAAVGVSQSAIDAGRLEVQVGEAAAGTQRASQDGGCHRRFREAVRAAGYGGRARRRRRRTARRAS